VRALKELEESNDRYNLISKATNDMVWDWNLITGEVYRSKEGWRKIFQDVLETELGQAEDWHSKIHPDDLWKVRQFRHQLDSGAIGDTFEVECKVIKKDGSIAYVLDRGYVVRNESGHPVRLIGALQNITLRKQTEFKLRDEQGLRHKQITDAVITAQEDERQYIGTELHDNVNQILTSAALYLNLASSEKANKDTFIQQAERILNSGIHEIRKLSHSLIRPALHTRTLEEALDNLLDTAEQSGLYTICRGYQHFDEEGISDKLKLAIFRIIQEQTNNIIKYASAKHIRVQLLRNHKHIVLRVEDNGIGFDPQHKSNGVGLTNIKTRAALHNGQMKITSAPNKGCILEVSFPIEAAELVHFG
jgi:two-component system sensor histidine kinase UhpB